MRSTFFSLQNIRLSNKSQTSSSTNKAMELFPLTLLSILLSTLLYLVFSTKSKTTNLPPGPPSIPLLGNLLWLKHSISDVENILKNLCKRHGPIVTLRVGSVPVIFISDRAVAHQALVGHGSIFSDRPAPAPATKFISSDQHNISSAGYGPLWRLLRRNLTSEILHASRIKIYADGRGWVLDVLIDHLYKQSLSSNDGSVVAKDSFQFAMFCLLVLMCFGEKLDEEAIREIECANRSFLLHLRNLDVLAFLPSVSRYIFSSRWRTAMELRQKQVDLFLPLIKARREHKQRRGENGERFVYSYLDSILDIKLEEGGRSLTEDEMVSLCSEFLNAGTDTTSTALQWIMAELVKNQEIQKKLIEEIESVVGESERTVKEEELQKMPYLKAVILEGLRRHPPGHFVLPHAVTEEIEIAGYVVPRNASVNFMVAEMGWDGRVWKDPMEFKPERFLDGGEGEGVDVTGSREIKMMPFGAGRRICPGLGLAMLHLEYFVANLVREFDWKAADGDEVDLSEKREFTVVMNHPLRAKLIPRKKEI